MPGFPEMYLFNWYKAEDLCKLYPWQAGYSSSMLILEKNH